MSEFSFGQDVNTLKYLNESNLNYLLEEHKISFEQAAKIMIKLGFSIGKDEINNNEYWGK